MTLTSGFVETKVDALHFNSNIQIYKTVAQTRLTETNIWE